MVEDIRFTPNQHSPYQSFRLDGSDQEFNYFGALDLSALPNNSEMDFQYELRGKYANVREIQGYDHVRKLDIKALKSEYEKSLQGTSTPEEVRNELHNQYEKNSSEDMEEPGFVRQEIQNLSREIKAKAKMNAGNTVRGILELTYNVSAKKEDGSMDQDSFASNLKFLLNKYEEGVNRIYKISISEDLPNE